MGENPMPQFKEDKYTKLGKKPYTKEIKNLILGIYQKKKF